MNMYRFAAGEAVCFVAGYRIYGLPSDVPVMLFANINSSQFERNRELRVLAKPRSLRHRFHIDTFVIKACRYPFPYR